MCSGGGGKAAAAAVDCQRAEAAAAARSDRLETVWEMEALVEAASWVSVRETWEARALNNRVDDIFQGGGRNAVL